MNTIDALCDDREAAFKKVVMHFNVQAVLFLLKLTQDKPLYFCVVFARITFLSPAVNKYSAALLRDNCYEGDALSERFIKLRNACKKAQAEAEAEAAEAQVA